MYKNTNPYGEPDPNAKINLYGEPKTNEPKYVQPQATAPWDSEQVPTIVGTGANPWISDPKIPEHVKFDVDLSKGSTLYELIDKFKKTIENYPDDLPTIIYAVCGTDFKCSDFQSFVHYLKTLTRPSPELVFRGIIHSEFGWLLFEPNLTVLQGSTFMYEPTKLHVWLKNCQYSDAILKNITLGFKFNYDYPKQLTLGDLESIGFKFDFSE